MDVRLCDTAVWRPRWRLEKYDARDRLIERCTADGNLLVYGGGSALLDALIGGGTVTLFNAANAYLGVGDSSAGAAYTQTDLQAATNKVRRAVDPGWPTHTDGTGASTNARCEWRASFPAGVGSFAWNEVALFNHASAGRMLNRKVVSGWGTKLAGEKWILTLTLDLG